MTATTAKTAKPRARRTIETSARVIERHAATEEEIKAAPIRKPNWVSKIVCWIVIMCGATFAGLAAAWIGLGVLVLTGSQLLGLIITLIGSYFGGIKAAELGEAAGAYVHDGRAAADWLKAKTLVTGWFRRNDSEAAHV